MPSNKFIDALKAEGGCGLFLYLILAIVLGGAIYEAIVYGLGDPKIREIQKDCLNREESTSGKLMMEMSESERAHIADVCAAEVENYLARERQR